MQFKLGSLLVLVVLATTLEHVTAKSSFLRPLTAEPSLGTPLRYLSPAQARKLEASLDDLVEITNDEDDDEPVGFESAPVPKAYQEQPKPAPVSAKIPEKTVMSGPLPVPVFDQARNVDPNSFAAQQVPNLVRMFATMNFTDMMNAMKKDNLRSGYDPINDYAHFQPMWDSTLDQIGMFANATAELVSVYNDCNNLSVEIVGILQNMVENTNNNYVGYYN